MAHTRDAHTVHEKVPMAKLAPRARTGHLCSGGIVDATALYYLMTGRSPAPKDSSVGYFKASELRADRFLTLQVPTRKNPGHAEVIAYPKATDGTEALAVPWDRGTQSRFASHRKEDHHEAHEDEETHPSEPSAPV
ncbi:hypothetical protein GCM10009595_14750 [Falsarthrobacter nasiphocae]